ncbi:hypothetical protein [Pseudanabaena yagii]|uniref:Uncharacterized protein n=1 Tax=Pseudanabaena yagii GIHE-NHR1 TaxID=2722753 RepID=A0ABX1M0B7_9CYAN|nr:hypothetical protein [Pseudanabaena yagii]NMF60384.1 hypothetical protein [Pseudanabaena yagii GIHE-NHR1]
MAYSDFTFSKVKEAFQLTIDEKTNLFANTSKVQPSQILTTLLQENLSFAIAVGTEKARSEFIIAQVLSEVRRQLNYKISLFSGSEFTVDRDRGLTGFCDFLLSRSEEQLEITAPVVIIIEAKREDIFGGVGQCVAAMVAAQIFNEQHHNEIPIIYGAVTSGTNWRFIKLEQNLVQIDVVEYYISEVDKILGIFLEPLQSVPQLVNV